MQREHRLDGFTLIEIMAVVLDHRAADGRRGLPDLFAQVDKGRVDGGAHPDQFMLEGGLESYRMDSGRFPNTEQGLAVALPRRPASEPTAAQLPAGRVPEAGAASRWIPWGNPYLYAAPGEHNQHSIDIWSYGADGEARRRRRRRRTLATGSKTRSPRRPAGRPGKPWELGHQTSRLVSRSSK